MNNRFYQGWICFTGINNNFTRINFNPKENTFIWFAFKEKHFIVFEQNVEVLDFSKHTTNAPIIHTTEGPQPKDTESHGSQSQNSQPKDP